MTHTEKHLTWQVAELDPALGEVRCAVLANTERFNVRQLLMPTGSESEQTAPGDLIVHCQAGAITLHRETAGEQLFAAGDVVLLCPHEKCTIRAEQPSSLLLTMVAVEEEPHGRVQEASEESFPASDAPSWTGTTGT